MIHQPLSVVLQCSLNAWLKDWLAEIRADLRKAVAHYRCVRDDALYKNTLTYLLNQSFALALAFALGLKSLALVLIPVIFDFQMALSDLESLALVLEPQSLALVLIP